MTNVKQLFGQQGQTMPGLDPSEKLAVTGTAYLCAQSHIHPCFKVYGQSLLKHQTHGATFCPVSDVFRIKSL